MRKTITEHSADLQGSSLDTYWFQMKNKDKDGHEGKQRGSLNPGIYMTTVPLKHTGKSNVT